MDHAAVAAAIMQLINSKPTSPTQAEIEAVLARAVSPPAPATSPLLAQIRDTARRLEEAFDVYGKIKPNDTEEPAAQAKIDQIENELEAMEGQIPSPPQTFTDLLAWAEIARAGADIRKDGTIAETSERDVFQRPAARLVEAVLQMAGWRSP